jgi:hypothetical protein
VKKQMLDKILGAIDDNIVLIRDAVAAGECGMRRGDRIIDELLNARVAATEKTTTGLAAVGEGP